MSPSGRTPASAAPQRSGSSLVGLGPPLSESLVSRRPHPGQDAPPIASRCRHDHGDDPPGRRPGHRTRC
jgi:hypothetical protein